MKKKFLLILGTSLCLFMQTVSAHAATYEYDELGRVTKAVYEDGSSVTYVYDANGNIVETITMSGKESGGDEAAGGPFNGQEGSESSQGVTEKDHADGSGADDGETDTDAGEEGTQPAQDGNTKESEQVNAEDQNTKDQNAEDHNMGDEREHNEENENIKENAEISGILNVVMKILGGIAAAAAMGFAAAFLWKKHKKKKETNDNEVEKGGK